MDFEEWWKEARDRLLEKVQILGLFAFKASCESAWNAALENQWQPIESAPRDDEEFLGWQKGLGVSVVRWNDDFGCFVTENDCGEVQSTVTHWMPLPKPPEGE